MKTKCTAHLYIHGASVCLLVCLYPINAETADPSLFGPYFFAAQMITRNCYGNQMEKICRNRMLSFNILKNAAV